MELQLQDLWIMDIAITMGLVSTSTTPMLLKLVAQHKLNPAAHLRGVLELALLYEAASLERAFAVAHEYQTYSHGFIRGLLESGAPPTASPPGPAGGRTARAPAPAARLQAAPSCAGR